MTIIKYKDGFRIRVSAGFDNSGKRVHISEVLRSAIGGGEP